MGIREEDPGVAAWVALIQTHAHLIEAAEHDLISAHGIPLSFLEVLIRLDETETGQMKMQDLARLAWLSKSGVTRLVDRMEAAGLVERRACATDRRATYATITDAGRSTLRAAIPGHIETIERIFTQHLSGTEQATLLATLQKVLRANGQLPEEACSTVGAETVPA